MALRAQATSAPIGREVTAETHIPFTGHVDPWTLKTREGDYVQTFRIEGIAHETAHDDEIEQWHEQLGLFMRNISSPHLALWTFLDRSKTKAYVEGEFPAGYARAFNERYRELVGERALYVNELVLALVYRPEFTVSGRAGERLDPAFRDKSKLLSDATIRRNTAAIERLNGFSGEVMKHLRRYGPEPMGRYALDLRTRREYRGAQYDEAPDDTILFSEPLEFYARIVNGERQRIPYLRADVGATLQTSRVTVGRETIELRAPSRSIFGAMLGWKEYVDVSFPGQLNELLRVPCEFTLAQSFACVDKSAARYALKRQRARLEATEDDALTEREALRDALDALAGNQFTVGVHHLAMFVRSPDVRELPSLVTEARRALSDSGAVVVREDLGCEAAFYSMLPGNFSDRPRPSEITSRNFVGFSAFHNYPSGKRDGNHWGPALALLKTASGAPYYFSLHRRDVGHFAIYGSTGAGKTVLVMFLVVMLQKTGATLFFFDMDRGAEICIRALGGSYYRMRPGEPTGLNPFALPPTLENVEFVQQLMRLIAGAGKALSASEQTQLDRAVLGVFELDEGDRRMAHLLASVEPPAADNMAARLMRWVDSAEYGRGPLAWVFDNPRDTLDLDSTRLCGFDMSHFLRAPEVRTPVLAYLLHRIKQLKDGRRGGVMIDEGWVALDDEFFVGPIGEMLQTDRKKNWFLGLITQSPQHALKSKIAHTITEQTPTKIFLPNLNAKRSDYVEGLGCTEGEFERISTLMESGRCFVVKQGQNAVVCELDLSALEDDVAVLAGTTATLAACDRVREQYGDDPANWLPAFHEERRKL